MLCSARLICRPVVRQRNTPTALRLQKMNGSEKEQDIFYEGNIIFKYQLYGIWETIQILIRMSLIYLILCAVPIAQNFTYKVKGHKHVVFQGPES